MISTNFYFDRRSQKIDGTYPLKLAIRRGGQAAFITLGISVQDRQWDRRKLEITNHTDARRLNLLIRAKRSELDKMILQLTESGEIAGMSAVDVRQRFENALNHDNNGKLSFVERYLAFVENKHHTTKKLYLWTLDRLRRFCPSIDKMKWRDINPSFLSEFDAHLAKGGPSQNYRNIHLRNIRAVFNAGIAAEDTNYYPFRLYKIRPVRTRKRALSVENLRALFEFPVDEYAEIYRDLFKLMFMLMGINMVDLYNLDEVAPDGRIYYTRAKTHRPYSIKIEPEAAAIIEKYRGRSKLLNLADRWECYTSVTHQMNKALKNIGVTRSGLGGKKGSDSAFPGLSAYWARHTWATIASDLDVPKETIAAALGHGGNSVTDIYIDFNMRKVDLANRLVLDWVLYGRRRLWTSAQQVEEQQPEQCCNAHALADEPKNAARAAFDGAAGDWAGLSLVYV